MKIEDLIIELNSWKVDDLYENTKSFVMHKSPVIDGEYYFYLERNLSLSHFKKGAFIKVKRTFHTQALSDSQIMKEPKGDIIQLKLILSLLDNEFTEKTEKKITEIIEEINPNGFF